MFRFLGALAATSLLSFHAAAAVISADFRTEADLPDYSVRGALVHERTGSVLGAGNELDSSDFVRNPSHWGGGIVHVDWDAATNVLTLDSRDTWDFQTFILEIGNIVFDSAQKIVGLSVISDGLVTREGGAPILNFTDDGLSIGYQSGRYDVFNFTGREARFQVILADIADVAPIPEPGTLALLGLGIVGLAALRRSRARA